MKHLLQLICLLAVFSLSTSACKKAPKPVKLPKHTLIYGGDVFLGGELNQRITDHTDDSVFGDLAPLFHKADITLVNGEGVITSGGELVFKGETRPYLNRVNPGAAETLKKAGVDIVSVGNNHACDYGRAAFLEMQQLILKADLDYVGGGKDLADAQRPVFKRIGDTVVALVGGDFTVAGRCAATKNKPGVLFFRAYKTTRHEDQIVKRLSAILEAARRHAQVVFLTPHWGDNHQTAPAPETRRLAKRLIEAGYDGILGHSAHVFQGIELIGGKPVIYDAGNLLTIGGNHVGMVWKIDFTRRGVTAARAIPIELRRDRTVLAKGTTRRDALRTLFARSRALGTSLKAKRGEARVRCQPGDMKGPDISPPLPGRWIPHKVSPAPNDIVRDALPMDATEAEVRYADGITLVGYRLYADRLSVPAASQVVELFFKTDRFLTGDYRIELEGVPSGATKGAKRDVDRHVPGDWLMPAPKWPPGNIITDRKLLRLTTTPEGAVDFTMSLRKNGLLIPETSTLPMADNGRVYLGRAEYVKGAPNIYHFIKQINDSRKHVR